MQFKYLIVCFAYEQFIAAYVLTEWKLMFNYALP